MFRKRMTQNVLEKFNNTQKAIFYHTVFACVYSLDWRVSCFSLMYFLLLSASWIFLALSFRFLIIIMVCLVNLSQSWFSCGFVVSFELMSLGNSMQRLLNCRRYIDGSFNWLFNTIFLLCFRCKSSLRNLWSLWKHLSYLKIVQKNIAFKVLLC